MSWIETTLRTMYEELGKIYSNDDEVFRQKIEYIVSELCIANELSPQYVMNEFTELYGETPFQYVAWNNIDKSKKRQALLDHIERCDAQANPIIMTMTDNDNHTVVVDLVDSMLSNLFSDHIDLMDQICGAHYITHSELTTLCQASYGLTVKEMWDTLCYANVRDSAQVGQYPYDDDADNIAYSYTRPANNNPGPWGGWHNQHSHYETSWGKLVKMVEEAKTTIDIDSQLA